MIHLYKKPRQPVTTVVLLLFVSTASAQLTVTTGASIFVGTGASVVVQGNMTNAGSITGSGTLLLQGSSLQTVDGTGSVNNLTLNNSSGATITSGGGIMQSLFGTLTLTNGLLSTNGNLTLKSNAVAQPGLQPLQEEVSPVMLPWNDGYRQQAGVTAC